MTGGPDWIRWGRRWLLPLAAAGLVTVLVARAGRRLVLPTGAIRTWDLDVVHAAVGVTTSHPPLGDGLIVWQAITRPYVLQGLLLATVLALWVRAPAVSPRTDTTTHRIRSRCVFVEVIALAGWLLAWLAKLTVARPRPDLSHPITVIGGFSFPSGHASTVSLTTALALVLFWPLLHRAGRALAVTGGTALVVLTCLDRVFLGVHYPSDVIGGVVLGLGITAAAVAVRVRWH